MQINYAAGIENIRKLFGYNTDAVIQAIEKSPPEMRLTLAVGLGLPIDLSGYVVDSNDKNGKPWFSHPFSDEKTILRLKGITHASEDSLVDIYERAPQEISVLISTIIYYLEILHGPYNNNG